MGKGDKKSRRNEITKKEREERRRGTSVLSWEPLYMLLTCQGELLIGT